MGPMWLVAGSGQGDRQLGQLCRQPSLQQTHPNVVSITPPVVLCRQPSLHHPTNTSQCGQDHATSCVDNHHHTSSYKHISMWSASRYQLCRQPSLHHPTNTSQCGQHHTTSCVDNHHHTSSYKHISMWSASCHQLWVLSLPVSVCMCLNHLLVRTITLDLFKLGSPNLDQRCQICGHSQVSLEFKLHYPPNTSSQLPLYYSLQTPAVNHLCTTASKHQQSITFVYSLQTPAVNHLCTTASKHQQSITFVLQPPNTSSQSPLYYSLQTPAVNYLCTTASKHQQSITFVLQPPNTSSQLPLYYSLQTPAVNYLCTTASKHQQSITFVLQPPNTSSQLPLYYSLQTPAVNYLCTTASKHQQSITFVLQPPKSHPEGHHIDDHEHACAANRCNLDPSTNSATVENKTN